MSTPGQESENKSALDSISEALQSIGGEIEKIADQVGDAIEKKYDELKQNEKVGSLIEQAENALDQLKDKAESLAEQLLGKEEAPAQAENEAPAEGEENKQA
jgi:ElaB/YqjD/DUF883 family membrane-anchored ribosome-binding protein